jgi:hypothetical protein
MPIAVTNLIGQTFNDLYAQRPVWALASNGTASSANAPVVSFFGEANPYVPLNTEYSGVAKSRTRNFQDEMANTNNTFYGSTTQNSSEAFTSTSGFYGVSVNTQTGCLNNFDAFDSGNYGWYGSQNSQAPQLAAISGVVVGESNWRQCFDLILNASGQLFKEEIGGGLVWATGGNRPKITMGSDIGGQFTAANVANFGLGQISHNRNSGHLLIAQPNGGVNGTSLTFRLHFFDLQLKIGRATTIQQIKDAMVAAAAAASGRYRYADVTLANTRCYFGSNATYDSIDTQFVLCDNDEVWAFKSADCGNTNTSSGNALFRINLTGGTFLTGTYTPTFVVGFNGTTQYGNANSSIYGARHMNSDDNSVVAMYQHYYYYNCGYHIAFVSTKNAGATSYNYSVNDGATGETYTIAPSGSANFVMCHSGYNNDGYGPRIGFVDNSVLAGTAITPSFNGYMYPALASSTAYGANMVLKVQPTTEWK